MVKKKVKKKLKKKTKKKVKKKKLNPIFNLTGIITDLYDHRFHIETPKGNFIWSNPNLKGGKNIIEREEECLIEYLESHFIALGRHRGIHKIKDYCKDKDGNLAEFKE